MKTDKGWNQMTADEKIAALKIDLDQAYDLLDRKDEQIARIEAFLKRIKASALD